MRRALLILTAGDHGPRFGVVRGRRPHRVPTRTDGSGARTCSPHGQPRHPHRPRQHPVLPAVRRATPLDVVVEAGPPEGGQATVVPTATADPSEELECDDGLDGDVTNDPGSAGADDESETEDRRGRVAGPGPECDDGEDNDGDGLRDYRVDGSGDPGCSGPADRDEKAQSRELPRLAVRAHRR